MQPVIDHAHTQEQRTRDQAVREHHDQCAFDPLAVEGEQANGDERHVRYARISDELLHVALHQCHERGVDDRDHRQAEDDPDQLRTRLWEHRQRKADETVSAHLQKHARQND